MNISTVEQITHVSAWEITQYANAPSAGASLVKAFSTFASPGAIVLDAGCGAGKGAFELQAAGFDVHTCDITGSALPDSFPFPFFLKPLWKELSLGTSDGLVDWTYCCEVLEYLPIQFTMLAVEQMLRLSKQGLFLSVSTQPDIHGVWIGHPLRQTVQGFAWWRDSLRELGELVDARDMVASALFVIRRSS